MDARSSSRPRWNGLVPAGSATGSVNDLTHWTRLPRRRRSAVGWAIRRNGSIRLRDEAIACMALPDLKPAGPPIRTPEGMIAFAL